MTAFVAAYIIVAIVMVQELPLAVVTIRKFTRSPSAIVSECVASSNSPVELGATEMLAAPAPALTRDVAVNVPLELDALTY